MINTQKINSSKVNAIKITSKPHIFAIGSKEINIVSIDKNFSINVAVRCPPMDDGSEITSLNWNDKVAHILAASTSSGMVYIWDMKKVELFLTICDQSLMGENSYHREEVVNTTVLWSADGAQVIIAYDDPEYNFITQYHMRQPKAPAAEYHGGHSKPIIDLARNPHDPNLLLSLGRDNIVTCWSMRSQRPLVHYTLPHKGWNQIIWMNKFPDVFLSVSEDGTIHHNRINFCQDVTVYNEELSIPRWFSKTVGVNFGFHSKLVTFSDKYNPNVNIYNVIGDKNLSDLMKSFIEKVERQDKLQLLDEKIDSTKNNTALFWVALKSIYTKNFNELYTYLGYDKQKLHNDSSAFLGKKAKTTKARHEAVTQKVMFQEEDLEEIFTKTESTSNNSGATKQGNQTPHHENEKPNTIQEIQTININWNVGNEKLIKQSLLIGDLESAMEIAFKSGRTTEAFWIALCNPELLAKAKQIYFSNNKDLYVKSIFPAIINKNFEGLYDSNIIKEWKEYLLYAKTYLGEGQDFSNFANGLGDKLSNYHEVSLICYVLAERYEKCIELIYTNYTSNLASTREERRYQLQNVFEQCTSITKVMNTNMNNTIYHKILIDYCEQLIEEGLLLEASNYLIKDNSNPKVMELYDRIYHNCEQKMGKMPKPHLPYNIVLVKPKFEKVKKTIQSNVTKFGQQANNNLFDGPPKNGVTSTSTTPMMNNPPKITKGPFGMSKETPNPVTPSNNVMNHPPKLTNEGPHHKHSMSMMTEQVYKTGMPQYKQQVLPPKPNFNEISMNKSNSPSVNQNTPTTQPVINLSNMRVNTVQPPKPQFVQPPSKRNF